MSDSDTRDIAVEANVKVDQHIQDCVRFRTIIADSFKTVNDNMNKQGEKINTLQIRAALLLGGLIVIGKGIDMLMAWLHK